MAEDYTNINAITPMKRFNIELSKVRLEFDRRHEPFDEQCARIDFVDRLQELEKESERRHGFIKVDEIKIDNGNLNKYGDISLFEFIEEQPHLQDKVIEGTRTQVLTGYQKTFKCKRRGHGISIFIPIADYKKETKVKDNLPKEK